MQEERKLFVKKIDSPIEIFPYMKIVKKFLSVKNIWLKKIISKIIKFSIGINYEYRCLKCHVKIKTFGDSLLCEVPIKKYKKNGISKVIKCVTMLVEENKIKDVVLSNELNEIEELKTAFQNKKQVEGKYLLKVMVDEVIDYISNIKNERTENQTIYILVNEYSKINLEIIELLSNKVKSVNIITNRLKRFLNFEKRLYEDNGIMITVSNNKRRALNKANWIINLDFSNDSIKQYKINRNAIFVNLKLEQPEVSKSFSGVIVNGLNIDDVFNKDFRYSKMYKVFNRTLVYENIIQKNKSITEIKEKIADDGIKIKSLIGSRGELKEVEYKNCLTNT